MSSTNNLINMLANVYMEQGKYSGAKEQFLKDLEQVGGDVGEIAREEAEFHCTFDSGCVAFVEDFNKMHEYTELSRELMAGFLQRGSESAAIWKKAETNRSKAIAIVSYLIERIYTRLFLSDKSC